jgi:chaperonin GroEL
MLKQTLYGKDGRSAMFSGVGKIVGAIRVTLGPMGRLVVIAQSAIADYDVHSLPVRITKDGFTVARDFNLPDYFERVGVMLVKECTFKTVLQCGDGTSTSAILVHSILEKAIEAVDDGANPMELKREIDAAVELAVSELKRLATPIKGNVERIREIATVSANNDKAIGDMIADAFAKIGDEGVIDIEPNPGVKTEIKIAEGYKFDKGWGEISDRFVTDRNKMMGEFLNPLILLYDKRINHHTQIERGLTLAIESSRPLFIVCEDSDGEGLATLAVNNGRSVKIGIVKSPAYGDARREQMEDIAAVTGGTYLSDIKGVGIKEIEIENFGQADKIIATRDETIIVGGRANNGEVEGLLNELRMNLAQAKNEEEKAPIEKRIARLTGGIAVIQVGANTETEMKERMDRFDDAIRATKSAIEEGYLPGGGSVFAKMDLSSLGTKGAEILSLAIKEPLRQICANAGITWDAILTEVAASEKNIGYNAKNNKIEDLVKAGIIDPVKVLRCALQNAASSATMILTSEAMIVDTM